MRKWNEMQTDEIQGIWNSYIRTEFDDLLKLSDIPRGAEFKNSTRITPLEMIKLVDDLLRRLQGDD